MSNKKWRTPPSHTSGSDDVAPQAPPETQAAHAPPATLTKASSGDEIIPLERYPADYHERSTDGDLSQIPDGCYRVPIGAGLGVVDMRLQIGALGPVGQDPRPLTDAEIEGAARDSVRFLRQVMTLTSRLLESVQLGDIRKVVASEFAMPGDAVLADGTISKHPDVLKVQNGSGSRRPGTGKGAGEPDTSEPDSKRFSKAARRPRGSSHPFLVLLRLAVQSARLIKQIGSGLRPEVFNRIRREADTAYDKFMDAADWAQSLVDGT
ncbi:MAG: hypothetical protein H6839_08305 [Planctomycetes bacterium]|nr:hypothetical protein [Planctomycetota bacterium]